MKFLSAFLLICHLIVVNQSAVAEKTAATQRPNILFLFTDDQAPWAIGVSGHPHAETPHMDKLFKQGAYLVNAFTVTPVCSPSRASLMTSRYGSEVGITDWIHPRKEAKLGLNPKFPVWPKLLQQAGYRTGLIGKWHLGTQDRFHPTKYGYGYFMGFRSGGSVPKDPILEVNGQNKKLKGFLPDILTDDAIRFISQKSKQPFLLSLHFRAPHARWLPVADEDWAPFKNLDPKIPNPDYPHLDIPRVKRMTREYLASVASVDRNVGRLLAELDRLKLSENTIVIYSSDHGYNMGHNGIWHKGNGHWVLKPPPPAQPNIPRGQRPNMYDHSLRVPTAIRWPGVIDPGTKIMQTISNLDWFPTILEMAGVEIPKGTLLRGRSIVPLLRKEKIAWNNDFYAEYSTHHQSKTDMRMIRTSRWKLIRDFKNRDRDELYDLQNDPQEATNLIESKETIHRRIRVLLNQRIETQMQKLNDPALKN
ncbi:MAG: sulfatase-like hydrolase/transferase [Planctomycetaceae bacterium]